MIRVMFSFSDRVGVGLVDYSTWSECIMSGSRHAGMAFYFLKGCELK